MCVPHRTARLVSLGYKRKGAEGFMTADPKQLKERIKKRWLDDIWMRSLLPVGLASDLEDLVACIEELERKIEWPDDDWGLR